jgi:hypothetical protein
MSNASAIHVNDVGTEFQVTVTDDAVPEVGLDLSSATTLEFCFEKPDGTVTTVTAVGVDLPNGVLSYTTVLGDLDQAGPWKLQVHYVLPAAERRADVLSFTVKENVCA